MSKASPSLLSPKSFAHSLLALAALAVLVQAGLGASMTAPVVPCATPGCLDESFGNAGIAQFDLVTGSESSWGIAVDPVGGIVSVGEGSLALGHSTMLITRALANGALDTSFGTDGVVRPQFTSAQDQEFASAVAIAPDLDADFNDFDIVVAGNVFLAPAKGNKPAMYACGLVRLNSDGSLEADFGTGGKLLLAFAAGQSASCGAVAVDTTFTPLGQIVVAGVSSNVAAVARLHADGDFDTAFNTTGKLLTTETAPTGLRVDATGRVLISTRTRVLRWAWNGDADSSFGGGSGRVDTGVIQSGPAHGLALDPNGRIIVVGDYSTTVQTSFKPARYTTTTDVGVVVLHGSNGQRDLSFGLNGLATVDFGSSNDFATGVAVDDAGRVLVTSWTIAAKTFILARLNPSGSLDSSFAAGGIAWNPIDPQGANPSAGVIATADGIVVGGRSGPGERTTLARYVQ